MSSRLRCEFVLTKVRIYCGHEGCNNKVYIEHFPEKELEDFRCPRHWNDSCCPKFLRRLYGEVPIEKYNPIPAGGYARCQACEALFLVRKDYWGPKRNVRCPLCRGPKCEERKDYEYYLEREGIEGFEESLWESSDEEFFYGDE